MDTLRPGSIKNFVSDQGSVSMCSSRNPVNGFKLNNDVVDPHHLPSIPTNSYSPSSELTSSSHSSLKEDSSNNSDVSNNVVLKYISEILLEEDLQGKNCMLQDCLALQATEKSLYDAIGQKYPPSLTKITSPRGDNLHSPDDNSSSIGSSSNHTAEKFESSNVLSSLVDCPESSFMRSDIFSEVKSFGDSFTFASKKSSSWKPLMENEALITNGRNISESRRKKNHDREDSDHLVQERIRKHSAVSVEESELTDIFDKVLLCQGESNKCAPSALQSLSQDDEAKGMLQQTKGSSNRRCSRRQGNDKEVVDLWTLLNQCAQAVASYDQRNAVELIKQIRQHSSPTGDGIQRLAHYFVDGLEARLSFVGTPLYSPLVENSVSAVEILKAHQVYVEACPFGRMSYLFANRTIMKLAEKATKLHIIDFGVAYGFQWPCLIEGLSKRPGGPPKLCITGIELPQPGFRPVERVEETGRRLKKYCERFNVPFEYKVIAQKWETIKYEDLKIGSDEIIVVNCLYRLKNIPDDTVAVNSPRETVLKLINRINPAIFIHGAANGTYSSPFFITRFREALFHYSALFDMLDSTVPRDHHPRMLLEKGLWGRMVMNVIACEGTERVERPETYKQWQVKNLRTGFTQLPLDQEILEKVKSTVKSEYHEDFVVEVDGQWMLQGWRGRISFALSCWKPVQD
ncbi:putative transcription factor [Tripterygium wilfordii]|uniref:Putative transcription factor n=1 Tax=Tripterygium wilfordii TaxID=458696 RepID=A0A7J7DE46_TRIWF|nr:scarecrow-like protein 11 [Tripterygium wilfordii]XP_038706762.1 scarecrow-like protein 11 [Tripterygium wilfordii]KAF5744593.1 putative transcription factor [Tripterygium wilfordii]